MFSEEENTFVHKLLAQKLNIRIYSYVNPTRWVLRAVSFCFPPFLNFPLSLSLFRKVRRFLDTYRRGYCMNSTNIDKNLCTLIDRILSIKHYDKEIIRVRLYNPVSDYIIGPWLYIIGGFLVDPCSTQPYVCVDQVGQSRTRHTTECPARWCSPEAQQAQWWSAILR